MKRKTKRNACMVFITVLAISVMQSVTAEDGTWTGGENSVWINSANWSGATHPGSGADETATFDSAGNGNTTLDLTGLSVIDTIIFDTSSAAAYTLGTGAAGSQTLVFENGGEIVVESDVVNPQLVNAAVQLSTTSSYSTHTLRNDSTNTTLTVAGPIAGATGGSTPSQKILNINGAGDIALNGNISSGGGTLCRIIKNSTGTLTLSGANAFGGDSEIYSGTVKLTQAAAVNGVGRMLIRSPESGEHARFEMAYDGVTPSAARIAMGFFQDNKSRGALVSGVGSGSVGINHTVAEVGLSAVTMDFLRSEDVLSGSPSITVESLILNGGSAYTCTLNPTTADLILDSAWISAGDYPKTLELAGTATGNRADGVISNGINKLSITKSGSGTWSLQADNTYTGSTTVAEGTLTISGADGAITDSPDILLSGGTLLVDNSSTANNDRLGDDTPVSLTGGTLNFSHSGGASDYSETAGVLTVAPGASSVAASRADAGQSSTLTFDSLSNAGGTVDFVGDNLGVDSRNRILFSTPPALTAGIIGPWATVNGTSYATYGPNGITAFTPSYTNIAARGPGSVIPDDSDAYVKIVSDGVTGPVTLEGVDTNSVAALIQANTSIAATVDTASKTLQTALLSMDDDTAELTIGTGINSGVLSALTDGGLLSLINDSTNTLTINSVIADNGSASSLVTMGSGPVVIKGECQYTGVTSINNEELTFVAHDFKQTISNEIGGAGALVKTGTNELHLLGANSYTGPTIIKEGTVRPDKNSAFGTADGGVFIEDGATLAIGCSAEVGGTRIQDALSFGEQLFTITGDGVDSNGAIVCNADIRQLSAFGQIELADDASFGGSQIWRIGNNTPTLTLNDHTLTKKGSNIIDFYNIDIYPGEGHIDVEEGMFRLLYDSNIHGSETNTITVRSDAILDLYKLSSAYPPLWTMICENEAIVEAGNETSSTQNEWAGPVNLLGDVTFTAGGSYHMTLSGTVSGPGSINKESSSELNLKATNSTYTGSTTINEGRIVVSSLGNVGEPSSLGQPATVADGRITIGNGATFGSTLEYIGAGDTTDRIISMGGTTGGTTLEHNGSGAVTFTSDLEISDVGDKTFALRGDSAYPGEFAGNISDAGGSSLRVTKVDSGKWVLSGTNTFSGNLSISGGTLELAHSNILNTAYINTGSLIVSGLLDQSGSSCYLTGVDGSQSMLRIPAGGYMTGSGRFTVGRYTDSSGALYIAGGTFIRNTVDDSSERFVFGGYGEGGYGYLNISGGLMDINRLQFGPSQSSSGLGMAIGRVSGGTLDLFGTFVVGYNAYSLAVLTVDGGTVDHANRAKPLLMGYSGGRGEINVLGGSLLNDGQTLEMRRGSGNATNLLNLCGGTTSLTRVLNKNPGIGWVNFSGGTLKVTADTTSLIENTLTGVYSFGAHGTFAGGAVVDTDSHNVTMTKPIEAPAGNGVYGVSLSSQGSGYVGEPYVSITGGGGSGAAAVAEMVDDGSGNGTYKVGSIVITSPGTGYTSAPTVTLIRGGGDAVAAIVDTVTIAPNASGGMTKLGSGTLTLTAANTYTGTTKVSGGELVLNNAAALASGSEVVLDGGTLDLNGYSVTNDLNGTGTVTDGSMHTVISPAGEGAIGSDAITLLSATIEGEYIADVTSSGDSDFVQINGGINLNNMKFEVVDTHQLNMDHTYTVMKAPGSAGKMTALNLPDSRWHLVYHSDGTVNLAFVSGTVMIVR